MQTPAPRPRSTQARPKARARPARRAALAFRHSIAMEENAPVSARSQAAQRVGKNVRPFPNLIFCVTAPRGRRTMPATGAISRMKLNLRFA